MFSMHVFFNSPRSDSGVLRFSQLVARRDAKFDFVVLFFGYTFTSLNNDKMENTTTYIRDTNESFIKLVVNKEGKEFSRKIEKGSSEYGNVCHAFHRNNVIIEIGNKVTE